MASSSPRDTGTRPASSARISRDLPSFSNHFFRPPFMQPDVRMAEEREYPKGVGGPPVEVVAVEHDGCVGADALAATIWAKCSAVEIIANKRVVEVGMCQSILIAPGMWPRVIQQDVLVRFDNDHIRIVEMISNPLG